MKTQGLSYVGAGVSGSQSAVAPIHQGGFYEFSYDVPSDVPAQCALAKDGLKKNDVILSRTAAKRRRPRP